MQLKKIDPKFIKNKTVLLKVDYNVPIKINNGESKIVNDMRLKLNLPTIELLLKHNCKIIITSHLGRPNGKVVNSLRLDPIAKHLSKLIDQPVKKIPHFVGKRAENIVFKMKAKEIIMLENSRFYPGEKKNSLKLAKSLSKLAQVVVNDSFSSAHRNHATVAGIAKYLPVFPGIAFGKEMEMLSNLMKNPARPFVAIVGGAKISDKVEAIRSLTKISDVVLVGGGVANNFIKAQGIDVYRSYLEDTVSFASDKKTSYVKVANDLINNTKTEKMLLNGYIPLPKIIYPSDVLAADKIDNPTTKKIINLTKNDNGHVKKNYMFLDIGPKTQRLYREIILQAQTIFWNGPMGVFEESDFASGTKAVATAIAKSSATTVIGGGDTQSAINLFDLKDRYDYISAAGGAALEFLSGRILPGIKPMLV
jgi:phosphoglycerate kinase